MTDRPDRPRYMVPDWDLERVTPYEEGMAIEERIDEIVVMEPDSFHLEMMNETSAWMRVGTRCFNVGVRDGKLVVSFFEDRAKHLDMPSTSAALRDG